MLLAAYATAANDVGISGGVGYINNIADSDNRTTTLGGSAGGLIDYVPAVDVHGALSVGVFDHASVTVEYLHDEEYDVSEGGTGDSGHTATLKLAVEF